jgi:hypothetical protein
MDNKVRQVNCFILLGTARWDASLAKDPVHARAFQRDLEITKEQFGYALCQCRGEGLKLQIRKRDSKYHLAVWPEQGHWHEVSCPFFRDEESGPEKEIAAETHQSEDGEVRLNIPFILNRQQQPLHKSTAHSTPTHHYPVETQMTLPGRTRTANGAASEVTSTAPAPNPSPRAGHHNVVVDHVQRRSSASLKEILNLLWDRASLNRWHSSWQRDWGRARYELLKAASSLHAEDLPQDTPLQKRIFIPRPYREAQKDILNLEWSRYAAALNASKGDASQSGILIAPVRKIVDLQAEGKTNQFAVNMHLRHMRIPIQLTEVAHSFISRQCTGAVRRIALNAQVRQPKENPPGWVDLSQPEVVAIAHIEITPSGAVWARAVYLMLVHPQVFIPTNNTDEVLLVNALMAEGHQFSRLLTTKTPSRRDRPEWTVSHAYGPNGQLVPRVALELLFKGAEESFFKARKALAKEWNAQGIPVWTWTPSGRDIDRVVPPLPPPEKMPTNKALFRLNEIANAKDVRFA